jgi:hypothetical protein
MRDLLDKLNEIEDLFPEYEYPTRESAKDIIVDIVERLGVSAMYGKDDEGYLRVTFYTDEDSDLREELILELDRNFIGEPEGYNIVDIEEGAMEVIFIVDDEGKDD